MIGYLILAVLAAFIAVVAVRTIRFRPKPQPEVTKEEIAFDKDAAVDSLAQLVRCKTVSYNDHSLEDEGEFQKLISLLPTLYPNVFGTCTFQQLPDRALLLRWPGKQEGDPAVMMAHYDVVPVNEEKWDKPPFAGVIEDGILWGRGTLDTKSTLCCALEAAEQHLKRLATLRTREGEILRLLDQKPRPLVEKERKKIAAWTDMGFGDEALRLAYEKTVYKKQGMDWDYMNGILCLWHKKNLHTLAEIEAGDRPRPVRAGAAEPGRSAAPGEADARVREDLERMRAFMKKQREEGG